MMKGKKDDHKIQHHFKQVSGKQEVYKPKSPIGRIPHFLGPDLPHSLCHVLSVGGAAHGQCHLHRNAVIGFRALQLRLSLNYIPCSRRSEKGHFHVATGTLSCSLLHYLANRKQIFVSKTNDSLEYVRYSILIPSMNK